MDYFKLQFSIMFNALKSAEKIYAEALIKDYAQIETLQEHFCSVFYGIYDDSEWDALD